MQGRIVCTLLLLLSAAVSSPSVEAASRQAAPVPAVSQQMLVQANEIQYDYENDRVSAVGKVEIYHRNSTLLADRVVYDKRTSRLRAEGAVKLTQPDGNIIYADQLELTEDFREGFVDSLRLETAENTRFAAARADRSGGDTTIFQSGVYSACEPCKNNPSKPLLWQVKAARIIHKEAEKTIYYEDARIEFLGQPVAWVPYMWSPDPTVRRKTGLLSPTLHYGSKLGVGLEVPVFINLAPNYDVTLAPVVWARQGLMMKGEWRHRLETGEYRIGGAGIYQLDANAFALPAARQEARGMIESSGRFYLNEKWAFGWDGTLVSDRYFITDYQLTRSNISRVTTTTSQAYLAGAGERSYFDMRSLYFLGLSNLDRQNELPVIHPVLDYSYTFKDPVASGELGYDVNFTSLSRSDADFDAIRGGFSCDSRNPLSITRYNCIMRGAPGSYTRMSGEMHWRKALTDSLGQVFTPFLSVRGDSAWRSVRAANVSSGFIDTTDTSVFRAMAAAGLEYRWPFIDVQSWGTQTVEPIVQFIARPGESKIGSLPNEDSQSLVFDDTNLFSLNKYSGWDRVEGGGRANIGLQYTLMLNSGAYTNVMFGQSYHLFGRNSFARADMANTGLDSGLETRVSDYVGRIYTRFDDTFSAATRGRFDEETFDLRRLEVEGTADFGKVKLDAIYANYDARPNLGFSGRREGILGNARLKLTETWSLTGGARYSFNDRTLDGLAVGLSYLDECLGLSLNYLEDYSTSNGANQKVQRVMVRLELRTLGESGFSQRLNDSP